MIADDTINYVKKDIFTFSISVIIFIIIVLFIIFLLENFLYITFIKINDQIKL